MKKMFLVILIVISLSGCAAFQKKDEFNIPYTPITEEGKATLKTMSVGYDAWWWIEFLNRF